MGKYDLSLNIELYSLHINLVVAELRVQATQVLHLKRSRASSGILARCGSHNGSGSSLRVTLLGHNSRLKNVHGWDIDLVLTGLRVVEIVHAVGEQPVQREASQNCHHSLHSTQSLGVFNDRGVLQPREHGIHHSEGRDVVPHNPAPLAEGKGGIGDIVHFEPFREDSTSHSSRPKLGARAAAFTHGRHVASVGLSDGSSQVAGTTVLPM